MLISSALLFAPFLQIPICEKRWSNFFLGFLFFKLFFYLYDSFCKLLRKCPPSAIFTKVLSRKRLSQSENVFLRNLNPIQWERRLLKFLHIKRLNFSYLSLSLSLTNLPLAGNNLIISGQGEFGKWHPGWRRENQ